MVWGFSFIGALENIQLPENKTIHIQKQVKTELIKSLIMNLKETHVLMGAMVLPGINNIAVKILFSTCSKVENRPKIARNVNSHGIIG